MADAEMADCSAAEDSCTGFENGVKLGGTAAKSSTDATNTEACAHRGIIVIMHRRGTMHRKGIKRKTRLLHLL